MTGYEGVPWPSGFQRTPAAAREPYPHNFRVATQQAFRNIVEELERRGVDRFEVGSAAQHLPDEPAVPRAGADPDDPGVVAYFWQHGRQHVVPCDRWDNLRDNAQAIAKYLNAKRALDRYGVETARDEMSTQIYVA
jgi:hypothetical protein